MEKFKRCSRGRISAHPQQYHMYDDNDVVDDDDDNEDVDCDNDYIFNFNCIIDGRDSRLVKLIGSSARHIGDFIVSILSYRHGTTRYCECN